MIEEAVRDLGLDLSRGYFVGDKPMDIACGHNAGLPAILVRTGYGERHLDSDAEFIARDVTEALDWIFERESLAKSC
jgi:D-glycero-D-manno-heptose 1,7-bisphosphate phosphatase